MTRAPSDEGLPVKSHQVHPRLIHAKLGALGALECCRMEAVVMGFLGLGVIGIILVPKKGEERRSFSFLKENRVVEPNSHAPDSVLQLEEVVGNVIGHGAGALLPPRM